MASYDRMDWHYGGDFPKNLPTENGGTHIGMFLTWAIENDLIGDLHRDDSQEAIQKVLSRQMTGRDFLIGMCDEKFWEEDLNDEGNLFAKYYYEAESNDSFKNYMDDYTEILGENVGSLYEIENSWDNYDKLKPVIDRRYKEWKSKK